MTEKTKISIVLGSYNRLPFLKLTIKTVRAELLDFDYEIIVVDGGSTDGTPEWLVNQKDIITIIQHNRGVFNGKPIKRRSWGYFMNLGFKTAQGKYICMISDDCLVIPGAIKNGYGLFEERLAQGEKVGAMAFYYRNWPDEILYKVQYSLEGNMYLNHGLYLRSALEEVGYIEEDLLNFFYADCDLCLKLLEKGYKCIDSPNSYIEHYKHASPVIRKSNIDASRQDLDNYLNKWSAIYGRKVVVDDTVLEKSFQDPTQTADLFRTVGSVRLSPIKDKIRKLLKRLRLR